MAGLLFLAVAGAWLLLAAKIAALLTERWRKQSKRMLLAPLAFAVVFPLPLLDEIIGGFQFRALCQEGAVPRYEENKLRGRTVRMRLEPHPEVPRVMQTPTRAVRAFIPINERSIDWLDVETGEILLSYKAYTAKGGVLIRALGISSTDGPLIVYPRSCAANSGPIFKQLNVTAK